MYRLVLIFSLLSSVLVANTIDKNTIKSNFAQDIKIEFKKDFDIWDVEFNESESVVRFLKSHLMYQNNNDFQKSFELILSDFYPRYISFLLKYKENIDEVIIVGHTSSENTKAKTKEGKYLRNLVMSQDRALMVLDYIKTIDDDIIITNKQWIDNHFRSVGLSSSKLIYNDDGTENKKLSRRIELKVKFKKSTIASTEIVKVIEKSIIEEQIKEFKKYKLLSSYVKKLLLENPTINEQHELIQSLNKDVDIARAAMKPTITLNNKLTYYKQSDPDDKKNTINGDITLRYNLFNGFKDAQEIRIREMLANTTVFTKNQIETELINSLASAFIEIQKQRELIELSKENLENYDHWIEKEKIRFQNGLLSLKDFAKINSRDTTKRMNYQELMRTYKDSVSTFRKYIDFDVDDIGSFEVLNIENVYIQNRKLSLEDCLTLSPYIKEAYSNIELYKSKVNKAEVSFYPTVDLITKRSRSRNNINDGTSTKTEETSVLLETKLELYSGGKEQSTHEKMIFEHRQKVQKKDEVIRDTKYKVDLAHNKYELVIIKKQFLNNLISQRDESYIGANYDYKFAKIDANGLLDVIDDLYNAKKLYIENKYEILLAKYQILNEVGVLRESILDE